MLRRLVFFLVFFSAQQLVAHQVLINIFSLKTVHAVTVNVSRGSYSVWLDSTLLTTLKQGETLKFAMEGSKIRTHFKGTSKLLSHFKLKGED